jgi:hypothetical protein
MKLSFGHLRGNEDIFSAREWPIEINGKIKILIQVSYLLYLITWNFISCSKNMNAVKLCKQKIKFKGLL